MTNSSWPLKTQLSIEETKTGRIGFSLNKTSKKRVLDGSIKARAKTVKLPELSELQVVRHYTRLSHFNYSIDGGFYPLGSCTMKYNPRINEATASMEAFLRLHPLTPARLAQGALKLMYRLENALAEISGFARVSLQPAAGAQGEYTGIRMIQKCLLSKGFHNKTKVIIPDSAHGTNPATAAMCGFTCITLKSKPDGRLDLEALTELCKEGDVAAIMITNPNTLGLFEKEISQICEIMHFHDALVYMDGANLNALLGIARPGDMGVDVMHFNMHKTFTTPHGGGGPGCGGVGVSKILVPFLPSPTLETHKTHDGQFCWNHELPNSIGKIKAYFGHFLMMVRAYTYIRELGPEGVKQVGENAVLAANYIRKRLEPYYEVAFNEACMHEVVFNDKKQLAFGIKTLDIAKRLIDKGFHPPTVYFPLLVPGAMMMEPTETESLETIESFCEAMIEISKEIENPELRTKYFGAHVPQFMPVGRVNEVKAAKDLNLTWEGL